MANLHEHHAHLCEQEVERLFHCAITGNRAGVRRVMLDVTAHGLLPEETMHDVVWPTVQMTRVMFRDGLLSPLAEHYASQCLHSIIHRIADQFSAHAFSGHRVLLTCGRHPYDELDTAATACLLEAHGFDVLMGGGGVARDEIVEEVGRRRPDTLVTLFHDPSDLDEFRAMLGQIKRIDANPDLRVYLAGGMADGDQIASRGRVSVIPGSPFDILQALRTTSGSTRDDSVIDAA